MHGTHGMASDWRSRHPFTLGQKVWPRIDSRYPTLTEGRKVVMRGESDRGLWIALEHIAYEFPAADFTSTAPMPPVTDDTATEGEE